MNYTPGAYIDLNAIVHNAKRVKQLAPQSRLLAMIKGHAYGHGLTVIASALDPLANGFGVARLDEGIQLRQQGITQPIVLMGGFNDADELQKMTRYQLDTVIRDIAQVQLLLQAPPTQALTIWLKLETGMHRLGLSAEDFHWAYQQLQQQSWVQQIILCTHFANANNRELQPTPEQQTESFMHTTAGLDAPISLAKSAAILRYPQTHADWVRPGIMLYGVSPFAGQTGADLGLKPAMHLTAPLISIKSIQPGDAVGYGGTWVSQKSMKIGIVAIGYADGYPRHISFDTPTKLRGHNCPIIGRVSMDYITIDLSTAPKAQCGDQVTLWGNELPIELIAQQAGTLAHELFCQLTQRVTFYY